MASEISVKDQIKKLVALQKLDGEIYTLKQQLKDKPIAVVHLKEQFEAGKAKLNELEAKSKSIHLARKEKELELQTKEGEILKSNAHLFQLKTNKEYTAKITEIENIKADKSVLEEDILKFYDDSDQVTQDITVEKDNVGREESEYLGKKKEVEDDIKQIEDRLKVLSGQRAQMTPDIDRTFIARYEKVLSHKEGVAIVSVINETSCGGCFMNVTPQQVNNIKMNEQMISCEMCARILYIEEGE